MPYNLWYHHTERSEWSCFSVMIPETVWYNFGLLTMSTCARNM